MWLAYDTNAYSALQKGTAPELFRLTSHTDQLALPFTVVAELRAGFKKGNQAVDNYQKLDRFIKQDGISVLYADDETLEVYAGIWAVLAKNGTPIPTNDIWIAAICLQHRCTLATNDKHFQHVPLLQTLAVK